MAVIEINDLDDAECLLLQGLWLQRLQVPSAANVIQGVRWCLEIASVGDPLPPAGLVADIGNLVCTLEHTQAVHRAEIHGWYDNLTRAYEDYVLGKLYADWNFERAADAIRRYQGRDRDRAMAYLIGHIRDRAGLDGLLINPAILKSLREVKGDELLARGWDSLQQDGLDEQLPALYETIVARFRGVGEAVGTEDVFELESGVALAEFGQRFALRQVLQAATAFDRELPRFKLFRRSRHQQVPTHVLDEDTYPVGGFTSISNRGTIESLLHSELSYMETDERPDLFDVKYVRDELLYYSRDENEFMRRRQTFFFVLGPELVQARVKDPELAWQRLVLALALNITAVRKLIDLLSEDALQFEIVFLQESDSHPLAGEQQIVEMVLSDQIANGTVHVSRLHKKRLVALCEERVRRSLCHCLVSTTSGRRLEIDHVAMATLNVDCRPTLLEESVEFQADEDPFACWTMMLRHLLQSWI